MENILAVIGEWLFELWGLGGVKAIVAQTLLNVVLGVAAAIVSDTFDLRKIAEFLYKKLLPYIAVYVAVWTFGQAAGVEWLASVAYAAIFTTLSGDMLDSLLKLGLRADKAKSALLSPDVEC